MVRATAGRTDSVTAEVHTGQETVHDGEFDLCCDHHGTLPADGRRVQALFSRVGGVTVSACPRRTDLLVPPGTEHRHLDLDDVLARLTAGGE